jgi:hypothetical protein
MPRSFRAAPCNLGFPGNRESSAHSALALHLAEKHSAVSEHEAEPKRGDKAEVGDWESPQL